MIDSIAALEAIYGQPHERAVRKQGLSGDGAAVTAVDR